MAGRHRAFQRAAPIVVVALFVALITLGAAAFVLQDRLGREEGAPSEEAAPLAAPSPLQSPSPAPSPTEEPRGRLLIHGTGDVNVDPSYIPNLEANGWDYAWSGLDGLFREDDLTVINLECPISELGTIIKKEFNFRCTPAALPAMADAGVEVANQGNNHAYDYGPEALVDSIANLDRAGIAPVGAGSDPREALAPATFRLKGWRIAVVGFGMVLDPIDSVANDEHAGVAAGHDTSQMLTAIRRADRAADIVIVTIHWGVELDTQPRAEQIALGHELVDAGADVVFGHHAHRLQPLDHYRGRPIFWGLGNFVWPNFSADGSITAVAEVAVRPDGELRGRLLPAFIETAGHPVLT